MIKKLFLLPVLFACLMILIHSCYYDNKVDLYPFGSGKCDTSNVTYSQTIVPIMNANCNNCHNATTSNGNPAVNTSTYDGLLIVANNGKLWNAVDWVDGQHNMPQASSKLSTCDLAKINIWIKAGALNN